MLWLYRYLRGYLKVIIKGEFNENVLNLCAVNGITLWNLRLVKRDIEAFILIKDFKRLKNIIRGSKSRIHILKKYGMPFKINKNRNRVGLVAGIILLVSLLKIMTGYIWVIDIVGNKTVSSSQILNILKQIGITEGIKSSSVNPKTDREHLLLESNSLAWASLNIEGSRLTVNVTETEKTDNDSGKPANLKAKADGIIKKIDVTAGNCIVKVGDTVKTGDLLVSGITEGITGTVFTKSRGFVYADTVHEYKLTKAFKQTMSFETGDKKTKKVLEVFTFKIPLYLGKETKEYIGSTNIKNIKLFSKSLPIRIYSREFCFIEKENVTFTKEQLYEQLKEVLKEKVKKEGIDDFSIISENYEETEKDITLTAVIKAEENIAVSEEILTTN